jgi:hypothetical protein
VVYLMIKLAGCLSKAMWWLGPRRDRVYYWHEAGKTARRIWIKGLGFRIGRERHPRSKAKEGGSIKWQTPQTSVLFSHIPIQKSQALSVGGGAEGVFPSLFDEWSLRPEFIQVDAVLSCLELSAFSAGIYGMFGSIDPNSSPQCGWAVDDHEAILP